MEAIYPFESFEGASQLFKIQEYFDDYIKYLTEVVYTKLNVLKTKENELEKIACLMELSVEECKDLNQQCSISLLESKPMELAFQGLSSKPKRIKDPDDVILDKAARTLVTAMELKTRKAQFLKYAKKIRDLQKILIPAFTAEPKPSRSIKIPNNFVVVARVYGPFHSYSGTNQSISHTQDLLLLGNQTLTSFRDKITCLNDEVVSGETIDSNDPEGSNKVPMKKLLTSGMFFFGNTFYCDSREVISKDYGELIDRWAKENPKMKLGPFVHRKMEGSTVAEIEIRFGYPYVFMHLGNCEHLITFIEARLMTHEDLQDDRKYPLVVEMESSPMYCCSCDTYSVSWIVEDDVMPTKPAYLCKQCYEVFYTRNGHIVPPHFSCMLPNCLNNDNSDRNPLTNDSDSE